jgi:DHA2 family multidrug resistance protein
MTATASSAKWLVLVAVTFGLFASILDITIVNTAIPKIQAVFGADLRQAQYIATGYTLAQGVAVGATAYLATRFGIKRIYLLSLALFTLGSALCGMAPNMLLLIAFRVVQGAGGAALFPLSIALVFAAFPPEELGLANGVLGIPVLFAPAIGPTLGGYLVQFVDWRWIFYVNVPVGIAGVLVGLRVLPEMPARRDLRFDLRGFLLLATGLALLLYGIANLAYDGWSNLATVSGPIVVAAILLLLYIPAELRTRAPLLDLRLFAERNFGVGNLILWLGTAGLYGVAFLLPQYLQHLRGLDPYHAGLLQLPLGLAAIVGAVLAGFLYNRVDPRLLIAAAALAMAVDTYLIGQWSTLTSAFAVLTPLLIVRGLALSPLLQTTTTLALRDIRTPELPGASTLSIVTRSVVASLAVAGMTTILQTQLVVHDVNLSALGGLNKPAVAALYHHLVAAFGANGLTVQQAQTAALRQLVNQVTAQASALAYQDVYLITTLVLIPAIVLPFALRRRARAATRRQDVAGGQVTVREA